MTFSLHHTASVAPPAAATVRPIRYEDLGAALKAGLDDFMAMPTHVVFLVLIYPIIGIVIGRATMDSDLLPLAYPLAAGFALVGPFAALGMYELSRRRERGLAPSWKHAFDAFKTPAWPAIATLGCIQLVIYFAWVAVAHLLFQGLAGDLHAQSIGALLGFALTTPAGWALVILGNGAGFLFAALSFTIGVVSLPLLLDRGGSVGGAIETSIRAVRASPGPMAAWGLVVAVVLAVGSLPVFIGLAIALPVLGHATWHLYRKTVIPAGPDLRG